MPTTLIPIELPTLFIPLVCGGGLLFGCFFFSYLYFKTFDRIHLSMTLCALSALGLVFFEGMILYFAGIEGDLEWGRRFHRLEQLFALSFLFTIPYFIGRFLLLEGRARKINRIISFSALAVVLSVTAIAFIAPDLFVSQTIPQSNWLKSASDYGRGQEGPLYAARDLLLGCLLAYCLTMTVRSLRKKEELPYLLPMFIGLLFAIFMSLDDVLFVHTRRHIGLFPGHEYSRFAVGISVFIVMSMSAIMKRYVEGAMERERAYAALKKSRKELVFLAYHDPVTGLKNRKAFMERLDETIAIAERSPTDELIGLLIFQCGDLKDHGDRLGPELGDWMAMEIAARMKRIKRRSDFLFRIDAEEFALILTGMKAETDCAIVAEKYISELRKPYTSGAHTLFIAPRTGIAVYPKDDARDASMIVRNAGAALVEAKNNGNDYQFYTISIHYKAMERMTLLRDLRRALETQQFELHYQPQVNELGLIVGAEALIRWNHPETGMIPPARFIPLAEETGLIIPLGRWVLTRASAQARDMIDRGLKIPISVNLSSKQMNDKHLISQLEIAIADNNLSPGDLHIEITESSLMTDLDRSIKILKKITEMGCSFSIDDFGTGYSSLSYLKRLPIRAIKIDRSFVMELPDNPQDCSLVRAITSMARGLDLEVVAEGVESERQSTFLRSADCNIIQGYLYSKPLSYEEFVAYALRVSARDPAARD